jgi:hypothetical protein
MAYNREEDIEKVLASNPGMTRAEAEAQIDRNMALFGGFSKCKQFYRCTKKSQCMDWQRRGNWPNRYIVKSSTSR